MARAEYQVVRAAGIARGAHAQFARGVAAQEVAHHAATLDHLAGAHAHAFVVKRRAAFAAAHKGVFKNIQMGREYALVKAVEQERAFAVQRTAADGLDKGTQQASSHGRLEQDRAFGGGDFAGLEAAECAFGGVAAHGFGRSQFGGFTHRAVPTVALHIFAFAGDGRDG